jgi:hypothetical protein
MVWARTSCSSRATRSLWLLAVEGVVVSFTSAPTLSERLPGGALSAVSGGGLGHDAGLQFWAAAGCALAYVGALVAAGTYRFVRSDVT